MIWRIAREQMRSDSRHLLWFGALVATTIALVTISLVSLATQMAIHESSDFDHRGPVYIESSAEPRAATFTPAATLDELHELIDRAAADGVEASVQFDVGADVTVGPATTPTFMLAVMGEARVADLLLEGEVPGMGEVAVSRTAANQLDLSIGDTVIVSASGAYRPSDPSTGEALTISGITRGSHGAPFPVHHPEWFMSMEQAVSLAAFVGTESPVTDSGSWLLWSGNTQALEPFDVTETWYGTADIEHRGWWGDVEYALDVPSAFGALLSVVALVGTVIAAFTLARTRSRRRERWHATAQVLGARRRTLGAVAALEAGVVALTASILGGAAGYFAVAALLASERNSSAQPSLPGAPAMPDWAFVAIAVVSVLLAFSVAIAPALAAMRVAPVEVLRPASAGDRESSGSVRSRVLTLRRALVLTALAAAWLTGARALVVGAAAQGNGGARWLALLDLIAGIVLVVGTTALLHRAARLAVRALARRLENSSRHTVRSAGAGLARPGPAVANSAWIAAMVSTLIVGGSTIALLDNDRYQQFPPSGLDAPAALAGVTGGFALAIVVTLVMMIASRDAQREEHATSRALGQSAQDQARAAGVEYSAVLVTGIAIGAATGWLVPLLWSTAQNLGVDHRQVPTVEGALAALFFALAIAAIGVILSAIGSMVFTALSSRRTTPVEELKTAMKEGVS